MDVTCNDDKHRYEVSVDGKLAGFMTFCESDGVTALSHTEVAPAFEGRGVGSALVRGGLDDLREQGQQVDPQCPFVKRWIEKHADYADLVTS